MAELHGWLGRLGLVLVVANAVWLLVLALTHRVPGVRTVLLVGVTVVAVAFVAFVGLLTAVVSGPPRDPLHWLYAALALATLPVAAFFGANRAPRRQAVILLLGAIALVAFVVRLIQTGG